MARVEVTNLTRRPVPRFAYTTVANEVLPGWEISLVFVGPKKAQELNVQLRKKTYIPNVLSYALGEKNGEIFICLSEAERQAPAHDMQTRIFVLFLFIHALLHLKGWAHSVIMEECEQKLTARYASRKPHVSAHVSENSNRHRYRHLPSKGSRR